MKEDQRQRIALHRYGIIAEFVNGSVMTAKERAQRIKQLASKRWDIPSSHKTRISQSTLRRWLRIYEASGRRLTSLYPKPRSDKSKSRTMSEEVRATLIILRKERPDVTIPFLVDQMKQRNLIPPGEKLFLSTVYRFLHGCDLMQHTSDPVDRRKFEAEYPNDLWQSDVMHGPKVDVAGRQRKTYLIGIIDDHSRLLPHAAFYLSENLATYMTVLEKALLTRGLPRKLYVDNGSAFRSRKLEYVTASVNIALIHAKPYQPQGKGKIERWHKTVRSGFLPGFTGKTLEDLNNEFCKWLDAYHRREHSATGQTPFARFTSHMECLRPAPDDLKDHFRTIARRTVAKDRTITLDGNLYEAPVALIGKRIEVLFHEDEDHVEIRFEQKSYGYVTPLDLHVNCRVKRDRNRNTQADFTNTTNKYQSGSLLGGGRTT